MEYRSNSIKPKIKCKRSLFLLIGGGIYDFQNECNTKYLRTQFKNFHNSISKNKIEIQKDKKKWELETKYLENQFMNYFGTNSSKANKKNNKMKLFEKINPSVNPRKKKSVELIIKFFSSDANHYIINYYGHGNKNNGNWCFAKGEEIDVLELLKLWKNSNGFKNKRHLIILSDTCHSGYWINKLEELEKNQNKIITDSMISIQCGSRFDENSYIDIKKEYPCSLLMTKMLKPNKFWCIDDQHPTYWISKRARRFCSNVKDQIKEKGEESVFVRPCFTFFNILKEWKIDEKKENSIYLVNSRNVITKSLSLTKKLKKNLVRTK